MSLSTYIRLGTGERSENSDVQTGFLEDNLTAEYPKCNIYFVLNHVRVSGLLSSLSLPSLILHNCNTAEFESYSRFKLVGLRTELEHRSW